MSRFSRRDWMRNAAAAPLAAYAFPWRTLAAPTADAFKPVVDKAVAFLKSSQKDAGNFFPKAGEPGLTALVVATLLRNGVTADNAVVKKSIAYLESNVKPDGGIYENSIGNYTTCLAIMAFQEMNKGGQYDKIIQNAVAYVKGIQHADDPKAVEYGGVGYDKKSRADLSNTNFMVEALLAAGVSKDDPAIKKALVYVEQLPELQKRVQRVGVRNQGGARGRWRLRLQPPQRQQRQEHQAHERGGFAERRRHDLWRAQELPLRGRQQE